MRLRKEEREAEAMIVEHTKFEINFYSDLERLKTSLKGAIPEFGKLKEDARFWYRRGFEINQTVGSASGGKATLSRVDRLKTKAARALTKDFFDLEPTRPPLEIEGQRPESRGD